MSIYQRRLRFMLSSFIFLAVCFFLYHAVAVFGVASYSVHPCSQSFFIQKLTPKDRTTGKCQNIIIGDPVYFNLNTQRTFNSATMEITYKNSGFNKIMEVGILADARKNYRLQPLDNIILDNLDWSMIEANGVYLLQREKKYEEVAAFLNDATKNDSSMNKQEVLTYFYDLPAMEILPATMSSSVKNKKEIQTIENNLRGSYQFYTYTDNGTFAFHFSFHDLNINKDPDDVVITVYNAKGEVINRQESKDQIGREESRKIIEINDLSIEEQNLNNGFYKIEVAANDDIVTTRISFDKEIVSFINRLWLSSDDQNTSTTLFTDADEMTFSTINPQALQKIKINGDDFDLNQTYRQFFALADKKINKIELTKNDVIISGQGLFSFNQKNLYNLNYHKLSSHTNLDGINYIITTYKPAHLGEWRTKTLTFNLKDAFRYNNNYGFIISIPGLISDDDINDNIEIGDISVKLNGRSLWEKLTAS